MSTKKTLLVSVIIPNYNHASFLKRRIESILAQTYQDLEIIILDDCSTDNSGQIIEEYRTHPRVSHILYNQINSGSTFKQWNRGMALASGEYVWIAESDDDAEPNFIAVCLGHFMNSKDLGLVYTDSMEINEHGEQLGRWSRWQQYLDKNLWQADFEKAGSELNAVYNYVANVIPNASCVLFKKEIYQNSPFVKKIEHLKFTGDWWMWFSILQRTNVYYCHQPLNYFRYHPNTTRANADKRYQNVREQYLSIFTFSRLTEQLPDKNIRKKKFGELYTLWSPSLLPGKIIQNLNILSLALLVDSHMLLRIFKTFVKKIHAF